jgi:ATP-dependent DNA helicase RecG
LEAFASTTDGFEIAERDLEIRGFGDLLGTRQAGLASFRLADPVMHRDLLELAREDAGELVERLGEPGLEILTRRVERAILLYDRRSENGGA